MRRVSTVVSLIVGLAASVPATWAETTQANDARAGFLLNLARFTEWPVQAFSTASSPVVLGIAGDELLRWDIDHTTKQGPRKGRVVQTRAVEKPGDLGGIHMLYIGRASTRRASELLAQLEGAPVLTVSDITRFCEQGGMVEFVVEHNRVRFEVALKATAQAGLKVSSRVLTLAKTLHGKM